MTDTDVPLREQARSWRGIIVDGLRAHATGLWLVGFLFFALIGLLDIAIVLHINVVPIEALAAAEADTGTSLATEVHRPGLYVQSGLHIAAALGTLHSYLQARGGGL